MPKKRKAEELIAAGISIITILGFAYVTILAFTRNGNWLKLVPAYQELSGTLTAQLVVACAILKVVQIIRRLLRSLLLASQREGHPAPTYSLPVAPVELAMEVLGQDRRGSGCRPL